MPNVPKTPARQMRIPDDDWFDFAEAVRLNQADRAEIVRAFIRWYLRRPGAKLPDRPTAEQIERILAMPDNVKAPVPGFHDLGLGDTLPEAIIDAGLGAELDATDRYQAAVSAIPLPRVAERVDQLRRADRAWFNRVQPEFSDADPTELGRLIIIRALADGIITLDDLAEPQDA